VLYARIEDISKDLISSMIQVAGTLPKAYSTSLDLEFPSELSSIEGAIRPWVLSDDLDRSEKIQNSSDFELKQMLAIVEPYLERIKSYLLEQSTDQQSETIRSVSVLLETIIEAQRTLRGRQVI
jgi:hypothetical protein